MNIQYLRKVAFTNGSVSGPSLLLLTTLCRSVPYRGINQSSHQSKMFSRLRCRDWVPTAWTSTVGDFQFLSQTCSSLSVGVSSFNPSSPPAKWKLSIASTPVFAEHHVGSTVATLELLELLSGGRHELAWKLLAGYRLWRRHCFVFQHIQPGPFRTATALATLTALCCLGTWVQWTLVTQIFMSRVPCRHKVFIFAKLKRTILLTFR